MSGQDVVSVGINKRKKTFKPIIRSKRQKTVKPISQNKDITIDALNVDLTAIAAPIADRSEPSLRIAQKNNIQTSSSKKKVHKPLKKNAVPISVSAANNKAPEPVSKEIPDSLPTLKPFTIHDLNSFTVQASKKGSNSLPTLSPAHTQPQVLTPWFLRPLSELFSDSNASFILGHRVEKDNIKDHTRTGTTRQQEVSLSLNKLVNNKSRKKRKRSDVDVYVDEEEEGIMSRRKRLLELSKYDAELKDHFKKTVTPQEQENNIYTAPVVPQVTLQNGEIVLDTSSLVVQRIPVAYDNPRKNQRAPPGPAVTTRTKHFHTRNTEYVKRKWTDLELQVFYDGLSLYGTDFTKIASTIPEKDRLQVKNKYKSEEKKNPSKITDYLLKRNPA